MKPKQVHLELSITRVEQYHSQRFREAMRLYRAEFAHDTGLPIARIRALLKEGNYQLFIVQQEQQVLGFALVWICQKPAFVHLDYFAVVDEWKGRGIGTALYRWLTEHLSELCPRAQLLTLEVEDDLIPFYQRSRTQLLSEVSYLFPGPHGSVPMHLMVYDKRSRATLDRATVRNIIRGLYCGLHRRSKQDILLLSCLKNIPTQISLT